MAQAIQDFITRWNGVVGGAERANYTVFVTELCGDLDLLAERRPHLLPCSFGERT